MSGLEDAADLVAGFVPAARSSRWIARAIAAAAAALILGAAYWLVFVRPHQIAQAAGQAQVDASIGNSSAAIAIEAIPKINEATRQKVEVDVTVTRGQSDVRSAPDADVQIRGVNAAVRRSACMFEIYAGDPGCEPVHADPARVGAAGRDEAGGAPH